MQNQFNPNQKPPLFPWLSGLADYVHQLVPWIFGILFAVGGYFFALSHDVLIVVAVGVGFLLGFFFIRLVLAALTGILATLIVLVLGLLAYLLLDHNAEIKGRYQATPAPAHKILPDNPWVNL